MSNLVSPRLWFLSSVPFAIVAACTAAPTETDPTDDGPATEPGGPVILSFGANTPRLSSASQQLVLSVVLTDPDGVDDVVGGTLVDETGTTRGTFATSAQEGAYALELQWDDLTVGRVDVPGGLGEELALTLTATFFDQAGHRASQALDLVLGCEDADPTTFTRVMADKCDVIVRCGAAEGTTGCILAPRTELTGDDACAAWGKSCTQCRQYTTVRACDFVDTPVDFNDSSIACECL